MKYCIANNYGHGFFTTTDRNNFFLAGFPENIWVVGDNEFGNAWIQKVNGVEKTKEEAQAILDAFTLKAQQEWDASPTEEERPTNIILP
jgi:hypothetical protein